MNRELRDLFGDLNVAMARLCSDSRRVQPGDAFAAYPGEKGDGRQHIAQAIDRGAACVFWEKQDFAWRDVWHCPNRAVTGLKKQLSTIAAHIHGYPSQQLWIVGVTGTSGKTSCAYWIADLLSQAGKKTALIGTLGAGLIDALQATSNTTPDAAELQALLEKARLAHAQATVIEVSSHGLAQERVSAIKFDVAVFTNISRDHLDYHGDMEQYAAAKAKLFAWPTLRAAVINADDVYGQQLIAASKARGIDVLSYGLASGDLRAKITRLSNTGAVFKVLSPYGAGEVTTPLLGEFNVANLLAVLGVLMASGCSFTQALPMLARCRPVVGRLQRLGGEGLPVVVVDYAHKPDALEKVLVSLRGTIAPNGRLIALFGCGGERDAGKRPLMGEIAARLADRVIITNDNPRGENPQHIIEQILSGIGVENRHQVLVEPDRARAILQAIAGAQAEDVVLLAGKGHEAYQDIGGERHAFSDLEHARQALACWTASSELVRRAS